MTRLLNRPMLLEQTDIGDDEPVVICTPLRFIPIVHQDYAVARDDAGDVAALLHLPTGALTDVRAA